uniref:Uncharacterized protein n=1 Tax=Arundo donax TaxID=35708 RepID=A0A0A8YEE9_ARUDO
MYPPNSEPNYCNQNQFSVILKLN